MRRHRYWPRAAGGVAHDAVTTVERLYESRTGPELRGGAAAPSAPAEAGKERRPRSWGGWARTRRELFEGPGWTLLRLSADLVALGLGGAAALLGAPAEAADPTGRVLVLVFAPLVMALMAVWGLYSNRVRTGVAQGAPQVLAATSLAAITLIAGAALVAPDTDPAPLLARAWLFASAYAVAGRLLLGWAQRRARASRLVGRPVLIVGAGRVGAHVERRLLAQPELGLIPVGYLDGDPPPPEMVPERRAPVLGPLAALGPVARETGARHVLLAFSTAPDRTLVPFLRECELHGLDVSLVPRLFETVNVHVALDHLGGLPVLGLHSVDPLGWQFRVKHGFDRVTAALLLVALAPLLATVALAVKLSSPGPVLFRQRRVGRDGRDFLMLKFRSMWQPEDAPQSEGVALFLAADVAPGGVEGSDRRTRVGGALRRTSLDELPQLVNVLRGEMSLVGPRPERPEFAALFGERVERYNDRHRVKSGITGWAQVHGLRGRTSLADRVEWDNYYVQNWSLGLDLRILLMTVAATFRRAE